MHDLFHPRHLLRFFRSTASAQQEGDEKAEGRVSNDSAFFAYQLLCF
jgi:hypothetical protein